MLAHFEVGKNVTLLEFQLAFTMPLAQFENARKLDGSKLLAVSLTMRLELDPTEVYCTVCLKN